MKSSAKSLVPAASALVLLVAFLALSPAVGWIWLRKSEPLPACKVERDADLPLMVRLETAREIERSGNLEPAESEYRLLAGSSNTCLREAGARELKRFAHFRERLGPFFYEVIADSSAASSHLRTPLTAALILVFLSWLITRFVRRRGIRVAEFPVFGSSEESATKQFRDALVAFANEIGRSYSSEYAASLGITLLFDDLQGDTLQEGDSYQELLAVVREPEAKAVFGLGLSRFVRFLRDAVEPPAVIVKGDVHIFPGCAKAVGHVHDLKSGKKSRIEADTSEIDEIPTPASNIVQAVFLAPLPASKRGSPMLSKRAEDFHQVSRRLCLLALVMACKLRFIQSQSKQSGFRPNSWKTICIFSATTSTLE